MKLQRTIHAKLVLDRKAKRATVEHEYWAWQRQLRGGDEELYSATKQQADRFRERIKKQNHRGPKATVEYPLILRRDRIRVEHKPDSMFKWWLRLPLHPESIWVPIQLPQNQEPLLKLELCESKLIRIGDDWYVDITVQKQARLKRRYATVLPVDMGVRKLATTIEGGTPNFYGKDVRRTRGAHYRLRRSVGKARIVKKWKHKEHKTVKHQVHTITRQIVDHAKALNAIIVLGDLQGIRNQDSKGRSFNRRLGSQPFYMFKHIS